MIFIIIARFYSILVLFNLHLIWFLHRGLLTFTVLPHATVVIKSKLSSADCKRIRNKQNNYKYETICFVFSKKMCDHGTTHKN